MKIIILILFCNIVFAIDKMPIKKEEWLSQMKNILPIEFCKNTSIFRNCYTTTSKDCQLTYEKSFIICSNQTNTQIPNIIENYKISQKLGGKLGECIASKYVMIMEKRNIRNSDCDKLFEKTK